MLLGLVIFLSELFHSSLHQHPHGFCWWDPSKEMALLWINQYMQATIWGILQEEKYVCVLGVIFYHPNTSLWSRFPTFLAMKKLRFWLGVIQKVVVISSCFDVPWGLCKMWERFRWGALVGKKSEHWLGFSLVSIWNPKHIKHHLLIQHLWFICLYCPESKFSGSYLTWNASNLASVFFGRPQPARALRSAMMAVWPPGAARSLEVTALWCKDGEIKQ